LRIFEKNKRIKEERIEKLIRKGNEVEKMEQNHKKSPAIICRAFI